MNGIITVFKALSDRNRFRVVLALTRHSELCACQITEFLQVTGATASRHMGLLISCGLVISRKEGRWVYYRLARDKPSFKVLIEWVKQQTAGTPDAIEDSTRLAPILSCEPEVLCRNQRGESWRPKK
ncbi:metalloregulator ArsR/SmtB family transcription factor [bacterium]|nr:metalloregulator ArsR/SmtB family transcription factor [bacterium]